MVIEAPLLSYYNPGHLLEVQCDASQKDFGAALLQQGKPIAYISRALTLTEQRYAQMEKEMLAIVFALERFHQYTFGRQVHVYSDHKPLESILRKPLAQAPRRLEGMIMRLQKNNVDVTYDRGKNMLLADLLSRAYIASTESVQNKEFENVNMASLLPISKPRLDKIRVETKRDDSLQALKADIIRGWPKDKKSLPSQVPPYFSLRDELTVEHGLIFRRERVVIPTNFRPLMKQKIHCSHMGTESCLRRASDCRFWPGMATEIRQLVEACETCQNFSAAQPKEAMQNHAVDLFTYKDKEFLITVDCYSNFFEIDKLSTKNAHDSKTAKQITIWIFLIKEIPLRKACTQVLLRYS